MNLNMNNKRYMDSNQPLPNMMSKKLDRSSTPNEATLIQLQQQQQQQHHHHNSPPFTLPSGYGISNLKQEASQSPSPKRVALPSPRSSPNPLQQQQQQQQSRGPTPGASDPWNMLGGIIMKSLGEELPPAIVIPSNTASMGMSSSPSAHKHHRRSHHHHPQFSVSPQLGGQPQNSQSGEKDVCIISPNASLQQQQQQQAFAALVNASGKQTKDLIFQARSYAQQQAQIQQQNLQISQQQKMGNSSSSSSYSSSSNSAGMGNAATNQMRNLSNEMHYI